MHQKIKNLYFSGWAWNWYTFSNLPQPSLYQIFSWSWIFDKHSFDDFWCHTIWNWSDLQEVSQISTK